MENNNDNHNKRIFWYAVGCTAAGLLYVFLITFAVIPKENIRFADTSLGFILGVLIANCINYLTGGNPGQSKKPDIKAEKIETENIEQATATTITNNGE